MSLASCHAVTTERDAKEIGLEINTQKTKILTQSRNNNQISIEDDVETVVTFTYMGLQLYADGTEETVIKKRIMASNKTYLSLSHIFRSKTVHRSSIKICKTIIRRIVCYRNYTKET